MSQEARRPIAARTSGWAQRFARILARWGIRPNTISVCSMLFAGVAGLALAGTNSVDQGFMQIVFLFIATIGIQLRLLCNLFDGMVAIEWEQKTASGVIFNEFPDRFSDAFVLIGAGYASPLGSGSIELGWAAALLAVMTAYIRALGASAGASQHFIGPMAKPMRMIVITVACLISIALILSGHDFPIFTWALGVIGLGCLVTIFRRTIRIIRELESR